MNTRSFSMVLILQVRLAAPGTPHFLYFQDCSHHFLYHFFVLPVLGSILQVSLPLYWSLFPASVPLLFLFVQIDSNFAWSTDVRFAKVLWLLRSNCSASAAGSLRIPCIHMVCHKRILLSFRPQSQCKTRTQIKQLRMFFPIKLFYKPTLLLLGFSSNCSIGATFSCICCIALSTSTVFHL